MHSHRHACVLAGGSGERFWPMSRTRTPKHLLKLFSERTLLEEAVGRLDGVVPTENVHILTNAAQVEGIRAALPAFDPRRIVAEPTRRDTAGAAALATGLVRARDPEGILALLPSDAYIRDGRTFSRQLDRAFAALEGDSKGGEGAFLTFAIKPSYPATGFGYLEIAGEAEGGPGKASPPGLVRAVRRFVEKPDADTARKYLESGNYGWNAGMFLWRVETFLAEADRNAPDLAKFVRDFPAGDFSAYLAGRFPQLPKISLDYALMEKAARVATIVAEFDWDDVGTWAALPRHLGVDAEGNTFKGPVAAVDSAGNIVLSSGRVVGLCGVRDLIVVETPDGILVCHRSAAEKVKQLLPLLPKSVL